MAKNKIEKWIRIENRVKRKVVYNGIEYDHYYVDGEKVTFSIELPDGREMLYDEKGRNIGETS